MGVDVEQLYRKYGPFVLRRCRRMLRDEHQAREAMQDVFLQILRRQDTLIDRGLGALLHRTATNLCLNRLRSQDRKPHQPATDLLARFEAPQDESERAEARSLLRAALADVPESTALIVMLHHYDGLTLEQTAGMVEMSVSGVRQRLRVLKTNLEELRSGS